MLKKLTISQTVDYLQQISILLNDGYLLEDALQQIQPFQTKHTSRQTLAILSNYQHKLSFVESLKTYTQLEPFLINLLKEAEVQKTLPETLEKIVSYREQLLDDDLKIFSKFRQALHYPFSIGLIAFFLTTIIMLYVVPAFSQLFTSFGSELPVLTQFLVNSSEFILNNIYLILLIFIAVVFIVSHAKKNQSAWLYKRLSNNWLFGKLYQQNVMIIFLRTVQLMFALKRPLNEAFLAMQNLTDQYHALLFKILQETAPQKRIITNSFSPYFLFLIHTCLHSKQVDKFLLSTTNKLTMQLQHQSELLKKFIELLLLIIIGCLVGAIVIAVYLPLFMIGSVI